MQNTIEQMTEYRGSGLHTGKDCVIRLLPAKPGAGVVFRRVDLPGKPEVPATVDFFEESPVMCSGVIHENGARVRLIEHIMACLHAMKIDNILIEMDLEEPPFEDGSAEYFLNLLKKAGIKQQDAPEKLIKLHEPVLYREDGVEITAFPSSSFRVTFFAEYPHPLVGSQSFSLEVTPESFTREVARAQTFCFEHDVQAMKKHGLLLGATEESSLVYGKEGLINGRARYPDEPVRHKVLDLIGDLYLLGAQLSAHVTARKSGHRTHARFVKKIRKECGL